MVYQPSLIIFKKFYTGKFLFSLLIFFSLSCFSCNIVNSCWAKNWNMKIVILFSILCCHFCNLLSNLLSTGAQPARRTGAHPACLPAEPAPSKPVAQAPSRPVSQLSRRPANPKQHCEIKVDRWWGSSSRETHDAVHKEWPSSWKEGLPQMLPVRPCGAQKQKLVGH